MSSLLQGASELQDPKPTLATLPTEILLEIASYLLYPEAMTLRVIDRRFHNLFPERRSLKIRWMRAIEKYNIAHFVPKPSRFAVERGEKHFFWKCHTLCWEWCAGQWINIESDEVFLKKDKFVGR